ncbi:MAG: response regulator transcription factor [Caldilineaceae bacterium]
MLHILLADHNSLARVGMRAVLESIDDLVLLDEECDGHNLEQVCCQLKPDILILNISLLNLQLDEFIAHLQIISPSTRLLLRLDPSDLDKIDVQKLLKKGNGCMLKSESAALLVHAVRTMSSGGVWLSQRLASILQLQNLDKSNQSEKHHLTKRELTVLRLVVKGLNNREIAQALTITERTVEFHISNLFQKLNMSSRVAIVRWALEQEWLVDI